MKVPNEALAPGRWAIGRFGDMCTRKYDLDLAGANHIPCRYSWQEQGDRPPAPNQREERTGATYAAISLPAEGWQHQPKIPGEVSARISISQTGPAMEDRELRVEGRRGGGWTARTEDFAWAQTRHDVVLSAPSGPEYPIRMYTTDGLRLTARSPRLDHEPRLLEGALDLSTAVAEAEHGELSEFVDTRLGGKPISESWVHATLDDLIVRPARLLAAPLGTLPRG